MSHAKLTYNEAIDATYDRWCGVKIRDLCAKYDVDPRRLYDVWNGVDHERALSVAYDRLIQLKPEIASVTDPSPRKPKFKVTKQVAQPVQPNLFE